MPTHDFVFALYENDVIRIEFALCFIVVTEPHRKKEYHLVHKIYSSRTCISN